MDGGAARVLERAAVGTIRLRQADTRADFVIVLGQNEGGVHHARQEVARILSQHGSTTGRAAGRIHAGDIRNMAPPFCQRA